MTRTTSAGAAPSAHSAGAAPALDRWLPDPAVRTHHRREAAGCSPDALWAAAQTVRVRDCRVLGRLIRARIPGVEPGVTFEQLFREAPFGVLEEDERFRLSALCGRIWSVRGDFGAVDTPAQFTGWDARGTVRVVFASWVEPSSRGAWVVSEVRVAPVDLRARVSLRALGPFIATFQALVGTEPLSLAVRRAAAA